MIDSKTLYNIVEECKTAGHDVKVRDLCYVFLCRYFKEHTDVFRCLFDTYGALPESSAKEYAKSKKVAFLESYLSPFTDGRADKKKKRKDGEDISFDENLAYMLKIKKETEAAMTNGEMDKKDALKILADITVKLNDKFNINEEVKDQMVVVNCKYNNVCEKCGSEIYIPTKEDLIKEYNLNELK